MTEPVYLEVKDLKLDAAKREVTGLALPYGEPMAREHLETGARRQRFAAGAGKVRDNAPFYFGHDHLSQQMPVGRILAAKETPAGLQLTARIAKTAKGDELYALMTPDEDGRAVIEGLSVGYAPVAGQLLEDDDIYEHSEVDVFELSATPNPQYRTAKVSAVLSADLVPTPEGTTVPDTATAPNADAVTLDAFNGLSSSVEQLGRQIATLGDLGAGSDVPAVPFDSYGEFIQALSRNDSKAVEFLAYVGGTTADLGAVMKDSWVGERFRLVQAQRTALNFFSSSPLPATGMGVEYGKLLADTTQVGKQAAEGDVLPYGKISFTTARAALETFGGWGEMSRQEIERSPINVVERFFDFLLNRYAQVTEAKVNTAVLAGGVSLTGGVTNMTTADGWIEFSIRAGRTLKDLGYPLEGILVGWDVFEVLAKLRDGAANDAPRLLDRNSGSISIPGLSGELFSVPVIPISTGATTNVIRAANSQAIRTYEAPGAPFRLQDDDITNLTKAFSLYGYMATASEVPGAIVKPQTV